MTKGDNLKKINAAQTLNAREIRKNIAIGLKLLEVKEQKGSAEFFRYHTRTLKLNASAADKLYKVAKRFAGNIEELISLGLNWTMLTVLSQYNIPDAVVDAVCYALRDSVIEPNLSDFNKLMYGGNGKSSGNRSNMRRFNLEAFNRMLAEFEEAYARKHAPQEQEVASITKMLGGGTFTAKAITPDDMHKIVQEVLGGAIPQAALNEASNGYTSFEQALAQNGVKGTVESMLVSLRERLDLAERKYITSLVREEERRLDLFELLELMREVNHRAQELHAIVDLYQEEFDRVEQLMPHVIKHLESMIASPQTSVEVEITYDPQASAIIDREAFFRP